MQTFIPDQQDDELMLDVVEEIDEHCEASSATLLQLDSDPANRELLDSLFRSVHTIKGSLGIAQLGPLLPLITTLEDLLGMIREGRLAYNNLLSDLLMTILEHVKYFAEDCMREGKVEYDPDLFAAASAAISRINPENLHEHDALLDKARRILDEETTGDNERSLLSKDFDELGIDWSEEVGPDLAFFQSMMPPMEARIDNWQGRGERQRKLALLLNQYAGRRVDEQQLLTAVYLHDVGMTLLPLALLRKSSELNATEKQCIQGHVLRGSAFLSEMPHWAEARTYIYQHHERPDGSGYPKGLKNDQISDGAKILALVDAFEAMTHKRARQSHQIRPVTHALLEINRARGTQFCPFWVDTLNQVMKSILTKSS